MNRRRDGSDWFLTWTTFGTWLPGDRRGSTSPIRADATTRERFNVSGEAPAPPQPRLERWSRERLSESVVRLTGAQARTLVEQFRESARFRGWTLVACAVMHNHVHVVVRAGVDTPSTRVLSDLKSYGSRALSRELGQTRRWCTKSGSRRLLRDEANVAAAVRYVREQYRPLVVWIDEEFVDTP